MTYAKRGIRALCLLSASAFLLNGCATIFKGNISEVDIRSNPARAEVYLDGELVGKTPIPLVLSTRRMHVLEFRREGYETKTYYIDNHLAWGYVLIDVFLCFPVGIIVDGVTGAWYSLDDYEVNIKLEKERARFKKYTPENTEGNH